MGGDFELKLDELLLGNNQFGDLNSKETNHIWLDTGRSAILVALQSILRRGGISSAWLPLYCCQSVVQPFLQLGFKVNYYSMGVDLQSAKLPLTLNDGETVLFINYFGKKNDSFINQLMENFPRSKYNYFILEDNVQSFFRENTRLNGDYRFSSLRKFTCLPDGAMLESNEVLNEKLHEVNESFISGKLLGKLLRGYNTNVELFMPLLNDAEQILDEKIVPRNMSLLSRQLIKFLDLNSISRRRRQNWQLLLNELTELNLTKYCKPLYLMLNDLEVPIGFPLIIHNRRRDDLLKVLQENEIFCPVHWRLPSSVSEKEWPLEFQLSKSLVTLPIDQRLDAKHITHLMGVLKRFFMG